MQRATFASKTKASGAAAGSEATTDKADTEAGSGDEKAAAEDAPDVVQLTKSEHEELLKNVSPAAALAACCVMSAAICHGNCANSTALASLHHLVPAYNRGSWPGMSLCCHEPQGMHASEQPLATSRAARCVASRLTCHLPL
jgi:hypothetical protein